MRRVIKWAAKEVGKSKEQAKNQPNPNNDVQLTNAEQQRVNEHKWIEIKKTRKTNRNNLVSEEPAPVHCSNEYEALKNVTINSDPQEEIGNKETDETEPKNLPLNRGTDEVGPKSTRKNKKARRLQKKMERLQLNAEEEAFFTSCIEQAEDERTAAAQQDAHNVWR